MNHSLTLQLEHSSKGKVRLVVCDKSGEIVRKKLSASEADRMQAAGLMPPASSADRPFSSDPKEKAKPGKKAKKATKKK